MFNLLLLSPIETIILIVGLILAIVFIYAILRKPIFLLTEKLKYSSPKKHKNQQAQDNSDPDEVKVEEKQEIKKEKKEQNKYNEILEKVHQNREQYYKEEEINKEQETQVAEENISQPNEKQIDFSKLDLFEDFNFEENNVQNNDKNSNYEEDDLNYSFAGLNADFDFGSSSFNFENQEKEQENNDETSFFKKAVMRKRMLKRNQSIEDEIASCSDRIKAIIMLDIINKKKF